LRESRTIFQFPCGTFATKRLPRGAHARLSPQLAGGDDRIDAGVLPPGRLVADAVDQPVMDAAERDRELVAGLAAERGRLRVRR